MFFSFAFCTFFKIFHVRLGKKSKSVSFSRVYVCVKAKLTVVSFFLLFLLCTFPLMNIYLLPCRTKSILEKVDVPILSWLVRHAAVCHCCHLKPARSPQPHFSCPPTYFDRKCNHKQTNFPRTTDCKHQ